MRRRTMMMAAAGIGFVAVAGVAYWHLFAPPPEGLDVSLRKLSEAERFIVSIAPRDGDPVQGVMQDWIVTVAMPDGTPVEDAQIAVDGGMPQHGHGLPTAPQVTDALGGGRYRLEGLRFNMGGWWVIEISVTTGDLADRTVFNIVL